MTDDGNVFRNRFARELRNGQRRPPTLTEAGCHCGQFAGVVMKSKTRSMGRRIWMLLQMRVIQAFTPVSR